MGYFEALHAEFVDFWPKRRFDLTDVQWSAFHSSHRLSLETWQKLRVVIGLYSLAILLWSFINSALHGHIGYWFIYLTNWTLCIETAYLLLAAFAAYKCGDATGTKLSPEEAKLTHVLFYLRNILGPATIFVGIMYVKNIRRFLF